MHPWLHIRIVIQNVVDQFCKAPKGVCLYRLKVLLGHLDHLAFQYVNALQFPLQECHQNRRHQIVYALNVGAGGMTHRPGKQQANEHSLNAFELKKLDFRLSAVHVDLYLLEILYLILRHLTHFFIQLLNGNASRDLAKVVLDNVGIFLSLSLQSAVADLLVFW